MHWESAGHIPSDGFNLKSVPESTSIHESPGVFEPVAPCTELLRFLLSHDPCVRLVAVQAFHALFHMKVVLSNRRLVPVAFPEAVLRFQFYFSMGLMALMALEIRHRPGRRHPVTSEASLLGNHCGRLFPKGMAFQARKCLHADTVDTLVLMAALACTFIRLELVQALAVTSLAFKVEHEHMLCMSIRLPKRHRTLSHLAQMTVLASRPGFLSAMGPGKLAFPLHDIGNQKLVLFYKTEVVALLTDDISVLAPLPLLKGLLHHMAGHAKLRIFLGMPVVFIPHHNAEDRDHRYQCKDETLEVIYEPGYQPRHPVPEISFHGSGSSLPDTRIALLLRILLTMTAIAVSPMTMLIPWETEIPATRYPLAASPL